MDVGVFFDYFVKGVLSGIGLALVFWLGGWCLAQIFHLFKTVSQ